MSQPTLSIVHVCHSLGLGGLERIVLECVKAAPEMGWRCAVAVLRPGPGLAREVERRGAPVYVVDKGSGLDPRAWFRLRAFCRSFGAQALHAHNTGPAFWAMLAGKSMGIPYLVTRHGSSYQVKNLMLRRLTGLFAARCVCVSKSVLELAAGTDRLPRRRLSLIYNGVDTRRFAPDPEARRAARLALRLGQEERLVISVGRLAPEKAFGDLLDAVARLRASGLPVRALLVGDGPQRQELAARAAGLGLDPESTLIGPRQDVARLLNAGDLYCLSSVSEGLSMALLEAMACGLPVVATEVGGNPEAVRPGENGTLVPSGDPPALAEAMGRLLERPELAAAAGRSSRVLAEARFSQKAMLEGYDRIYRSITA